MPAFEASCKQALRGEGSSPLTIPIVEKSKYWPAYAMECKWLDQGPPNDKRVSFPSSLASSRFCLSLNHLLPEIPGWIKWSPVKWRYKQWAGIYESASQRLNVNRGFGYLAYPGRVGMWPEISVITLKKTKRNV